jgi:fermentation-respiration switch protein FrsA (DUF1100 family)
VSHDVAVEEVGFTADGIDLAGTLRLPVAAGPVPAVAVTGPFTGVRDQVAGGYAERLARAGLATLAFDHRGFGGSGGRRGHEDSQGKLADLRAAVGVLSARPEVDPGRVGLVGVCLGGGYAVRAAAADPRVAAVVGVAGGYNSPAWFAERMGVEAYRSALRGFLERYDEYLPAVAAGGGEAAMGGQEPYDYYGTARSASAHWENRVTRGSLHTLMTFDALGAAPLLAATPLLIVHGRADDYCAPELAARLHEQATGPKQLVWLDCTRHIDLYDAEPHVSRAAEAAAAFLHSRM